MLLCSSASSKEELTEEVMASALHSGTDLHSDLEPLLSVPMYKMRVIFPGLLSVSQRS